MVWVVVVVVDVAWRGVRVRGEQDRKLLIREDGVVW